MTIPGGAAIACLLAAGCFGLAQVTPPPGQPVNQNSLVIQDFGKRLDDYAKLRKRAQAGLPDPKSERSAESINQYQQSLAKNLRTERAQAKAGDIFTPSISQLFRELIATPIRSEAAARFKPACAMANQCGGFRLRSTRNIRKHRPCSPRPRRSCPICRNYRRNWNTALSAESLSSWTPKPI